MDIENNTLPNGAEILAIDLRAGVVLAAMPIYQFGHQVSNEFVTWIFNERGLDTTSLGHYFGDDIEEARNDFFERCAKVDDSHYQDN